LWANRAVTRRSWCGPCQWARDLASGPATACVSASSRSTAQELVRRAQHTSCPPRSRRPLGLSSDEDSSFPVAGKSTGVTRRRGTTGPRRGAQENIKRQWWRSPWGPAGTHCRARLVGDPCRRHGRGVASGTVGVFNDPLWSGTSCHKLYRADKSAERERRAHRQGRRRGPPLPESLPDWHPRP